MDPTVYISKRRFCARKPVEQKLGTYNVGQIGADAYAYKKLMEMTTNAASYSYKGYREREKK
jgi:hypothetical protein